MDTLANIGKNTADYVGGWKRLYISIGIILLAIYFLYKIWIILIVGIILLVLGTLFWKDKKKSDMNIEKINQKIDNIKTILASHK